jgi:hypothetical protein
MPISSDKVVESTEIELRVSGTRKKKRGAVVLQMFK